MHRDHIHAIQPKSHVLASSQEMEQDFEILSEIAGVDVIAVGASIRDLRRLVESYGPGRWRKLKGTATIRLQNGRVRRAELHWYEAHGIGKRDFKIKRYVD